MNIPVVDSISGTLIRIKRVMSYSPNPHYQWCDGERVNIKSVEDLKKYPQSCILDDERDPGGWIIRPDDKVTHKDVKHIRNASDILHEVEGDYFLEF